MSVNMTPEDARSKRLCPTAAIMGSEKSQTIFCHGPNCGAWRWSVSDEIFAAAVAKQAAIIGEESPFTQASLEVAKKPITFGLRGYCGLGGKP